MLLKIIRLGFIRNSAGIWKQISQITQLVQHVKWMLFYTLDPLTESSGAFHQRVELVRLRPGSDARSNLGMLTNNNIRRENSFSSHRLDVWCRCASKLSSFPNSLPIRREIIDPIEPLTYDMKGGNESSGGEIESAFNWVIDQRMNGGRISLIQLTAALRAILASRSVKTAHRIIYPHSLRLNESTRQNAAIENKNGWFIQFAELQPAGTHEL